MKKLIVALSLMACGVFANADVIANQQLYDAMNVVKAFAFDNNRSIPAADIKRAKAVAILTNVHRKSAIASFESGNGVFSMKDEYGNWSNPIMIKFKSVGLGLQLGVSASDVVLLFNTSESFRYIFEDKEDTFGVHAGASFGHGARAGETGNFPELTAWNVTPGHVTGIFLGASVDLGRLSIDDQLTNDLYERIYSYEDILNGSPRDTKYLTAFKGTLAKFLGSSQYYRSSPACPAEYQVGVDPSYCGGVASTYAPGAVAKTAKDIKPVKKATKKRRVAKKKAPVCPPCEVSGTTAPATNTAAN